ncbi:fimbrial assembly protein [Deinococcus koreensis]|uniref:fimbrial assembly protein n=1 Tax=Deinococcus koreensis TaxID=2054903 RepID=UPI0013FD7231|nr:fimbrial assembly protein [Deinococcus koreensis]
MVEINLLPQQYRKQSEPSAWRFAMYALVPVTVAAILIPEVVTFTRIGELNRQIDALNGEVTALTPAKLEYDKLNAEKRELEQVTAIATQLRATKTYWINDLAAFSAQLPAGSGVAVKSMTIRPMESGALSTLQQNGIYLGKNVVREIDLTGIANSQQAVVTFLKTFETNPNFGVNFKTLQNDEASGKYNFTATVGVVGLAPDAAPPEVVPAPGQAPPAPPAPATSAPASSPPSTLTPGAPLATSSANGGRHVD